MASTPAEESPTHFLQGGNGFSTLNDRQWRHSGCYLYIDLLNLNYKQAWEPRRPSPLQPQAKAALLPEYSSALPRESRPETYSQVKRGSQQRMKPSSPGKRIT
jgi:hypothetical protein